MSKVLMELLKMDLPALAELIRSKGRGKDSVLAHITPKEAALLKRRGGRGSKNPDTGLLEFDDGVEQAGPTYQELQYTPPPEQAGPSIQYAAPEVQQQYNQQAYAQPSADTTGGFSFQAPRSGTTGTDFSFSAIPQQQFGTISPLTTTPPSLALGENLAAPGLGVGAGQEALRTAQLEGPAPAPKDTGVLSSLGKLATPEALARLGLATGLGLFGAGQARKGAAQTQAAQAQQQAIATPYQQQGQQLITQAQTGTLSPASQQAYNAAKAQLAQAQATRGGVGAQQAANQLANLYQTLLNNQYTYGLNVMNIGDQISLGAIRTGLQLDQQMQQSTTNFYSQLAAIAAGGGGVGTPQTVRVVQ
jgi:hypothetical protein